MSIDTAIVFFSVFAISAYVAIAGTWYPLITAGWRDGWSRIHWIALGLVASSIGSGLVRMYSLAQREFGIDLRGTLFPVAAIGVETIGALILAYAYFTFSRQRDLTPPHYTGVWAGGLALLLFSAIVMFY